MHNRKRICFVLLTNIYLCPYLEKYTAAIDCDYDIIYWNRHNIEEKTNAKNQYAFNYFMGENKSKISKLIGYIKFRTFSMRILQDFHYDGVIILTTSAGILLKSVLHKIYRNKYIVDIRDYTLEKNLLFFKLEKALIYDSTFSVISSMGYLNFLPQYDKYILSHNSLDISESCLKRIQNRKNYDGPLVISYIGLIRFYKQNKRIIDMFANDERFVVRFIGKGANELREYCKDNVAKNIEFIDWFPPEQTLEYYYKTDLICNLYGSNTPLLDYALSNKLYYAALLHIPILVSPGTYMAEISTKYGFGYILPLEKESEKDNLYRYYNNINWDEFSKGCEVFNRKVADDIAIFKDKIKGFVNQI